MSNGKTQSQSDAFIEAARQLECDDDPAALDHAMRALDLKTKKKPPADEAEGEENDKLQDD